MQLKRYLAPNMRQAMDLVRNELGMDAVIMSTRNTDEGVELVAAIDPDTKIGKPAEKMVGARVAITSPENAAHPAQSMAQNNEMNRMSEEIKAVRALLEDQLSGLAWGQAEQVDPGKVALMKRLVKLGVGWDIAQVLVSKVNPSSEQAWTEILIEIEHLIPQQDKDIIDKGGIIALVGPTGVGKTTTIAKMASRFVMRNSPSQLALITTDCYKIGAQAQLKTFADLLGVPVHVAKTEGELYSLLGSLSNKRLVLIDTAGMSQRDLQLSFQLTQSKAGINSVKNYLVMSAATPLKVMEDIVNSFRQVGLTGCILTKVDEALQLGHILTILVQHHLTLAYLSDGQKVPEDLESVKVRNLIDRAIVLGQQNQTAKSDDIAFRMGMGKEISDAQ
jgi:flagellar biosynthesis protein FlhF